MNKEINNLNKNCQMCNKHVAKFRPIDNDNVECPHCSYKYNLKINSEYLDNWIAAHAEYIKKVRENLENLKEILDEKTKGMGIKCKLL